jgi:redox-sensing transcriptional repressor
MRDRSIPEATVGRLPVYLRALVDLAEQGATTVSSETLAEAAGVNSPKVRKDLSHLGSYGTRGVGYDVAYLIHQIRRELGLTQHWSIVIAGVGNLGHALANYKGFAERGFRVAALVDADPGKVGERVGELTVRHIDDLAEVVAAEDVAIGVIATPAAAVQEVADRFVAAGVRSILNFAPAMLAVPPGVSVRKVDLAVELQILAFYEQRKATLAEVKRRGRAVADLAGL